MTNKQKKQAKELFERFGNDLSAEQIALVVAHDCECDDCGTDLLGAFLDFPDVDIEKESVS